MSSLPIINITLVILFIIPQKTHYLDDQLLTATSFFAGMNVYDEIIAAIKKGNNALLNKITNFEKLVAAGEIKFYCHPIQKYYRVFPAAELPLNDESLQVEHKPTK